jgi:hypothetical protein
MSLYSSVPDPSHSKLKRFLSSCKTALTHPTEAMASGAHRGDAIMISDDEIEATVTKEVKLRRVHAHTFLLNYI